MSGAIGSRSVGQPKRPLGITWAVRAHRGRVGESQAYRPTCWHLGTVAKDGPKPGNLPGGDLEVQHHLQVEPVGIGSSADILERLLLILADEVVGVTSFEAGKLV